MSNGFRPGRGCKDALREVDGYLKDGYTYVVDADLKGYFDSNRRIFPFLDRFVRRRLRAILRKQEKRKGWGKCYADHIRWSNVYFAKLGLFTMTNARMVASQSR